MAQLGTDGPTISVLGLGAWAIGGGWEFGWGPQDDAESVAAIEHAVDLGVNWVDTAAAYGWGHSEEVVGRALRDHSDVMVFTKCGILPDPGGQGVSTLRSLNPDSIRKEREASLRRLGREHIDLYQFHWPHPDDTVALEDSWAAMLDLVESGKVRWPGVSNFDASQLERCERSGHVQSLQPPYSLVRREAEDSTLPWCSAHGTGVIAYSPLQSGLLTGAFSERRVASLPEDDWRRRSEWFTEPKLGRVLELVSHLELIAEECELSLSELAVAWVLSHPAITGVIVGARRPEQVDGWIGAGIVELGAGIAGDLVRMAAGLVNDRPETDEPDGKTA